MVDPDQIVERMVILSMPLWGPFYAVYYIIRLLIKEITDRGEK